MLVIIVSTDEKSYVHKEIKKLLGKRYKSEYLQIGDFWVNNFIIERKQINDLYKSAMDGTLFKQLENMKKFANDNPTSVMILLIEGTKLKPRLQQYAKFIPLQELTINALAHFGVIPIFTKHITDTARFIKDLNIYNSKDKSVIRSARGFKRQKSLEAQKTFVLESFPTIGETKSKVFLKKHKNLMSFFKWIVTNKKDTKVYDVLMK